MFAITRPGNFQKVEQMFEYSLIMKIGGLMASILLIITLCLLFTIKLLSKYLDKQNCINMVRLVAIFLSYLLIATVVLHGTLLLFTSFVIIFSNSGNLLNAHVQRVILIVGGFLVSIYLFLEQRSSLNYYRNHCTSTIIAAFLKGKYSKFLASGDFEQARESLFRACQIAPYGVELWAELAFFCETVMNQNEQADLHIEKASQLVESSSDISNKERACYESYLGHILLHRNKVIEGMKHIQCSVDLDPTPRRLAIYEEKLFDMQKHNNNRNTMKRCDR